jgi:hypothetical protein
MSPPRDNSETIRNGLRKYRKWRWSEASNLDEPTRWKESILRLSPILRLCRDDAERARVMRWAAESPVKNTRGRDANAEVDRLARLAIAHGGIVKCAVPMVLEQERADLNLAGQVTNRVNHLKRKRQRINARG